MSTEVTAAAVQAASTRPGVEATGVVDPKRKQDPLTASGLSVLEAAGLAAVVALVVVLCALALYHAKFVKPPRTVATIDLDALVTAKEMTFIEQLSRPGIGDADRERAYEMVRTFGRDMDAAIAEAAAACQCDIFVRAAVVGRSMQDLTEVVGQRVGISMMAVADAKARVRNALTAASPAAGSGPAAPLNSPTGTGGALQPGGLRP